MDHKIDTLATLHNWTQGTPSLYPFTGIIQLYLAEEISVVTAVGEISAFMEKRGEGIGTYTPIPPPSSSYLIYILYLMMLIII